jgi:hypothetical protein
MPELPLLTRYGDAQVSVQLGEEELKDALEASSVWYAHFTGSGRKGPIYARASVQRPDGSRGQVFLHRLLVGVCQQGGVQVRFRDRNSLNCHRDNLEVIRTTSTPPKEKQRRAQQANTSHESPYEGIFWDPYHDFEDRCGGWYGAVRHHGRTFQTSRYRNETQAVRARRDLLDSLHVGGGVEAQHA